MKNGHEGKQEFSGGAALYILLILCVALAYSFFVFWITNL